MTTTTFSYTGAAQSFVVPAGVTSVDVDVKGAAGAGGLTTGTTGGLGGRVLGTLAVTSGETLTIIVGQAGVQSGGSTAGAFGGGGDRHNTSVPGGGGASDIRQGGTALANRVAVAGGGGGGSEWSGATNFNGGAGAGGATGGDGSGADATRGIGASGTTGGAAGSTSGAPAATAGTIGVGGKGGFGGGSGGGSGGGGYYGGGGGGQSGSSVRAGGGGGGNGYSAGLTSVTTSTGVRSGDGEVLITYVVTATTVVGAVATATADAPAGAVKTQTTVVGAAATATSMAPAGGLATPVVGATASASASAPAGVVGEFLTVSATASLSFLAFATVEMDVEPTPEVDAPVIYQVNASMPAPTLNSIGRPDPAVFVQTDTTTDFGGFQIIVGGRDYTTVRGHRTLIESYSSAEPFGDATCVLRFPGISPFEDVGEDAAADIVGVGGNPNVTIWRVRSDGTVDRTAQPLFQGFGASEDDSIDDAGTSGLVMQCAGALWQASFSQHQPHFGLDARDIGEVIAAEFNGVKGRRFATCVPLTINIPTRKRGSWGPRTDYAQELLSEAVTPGGDQWTVLLDRGRVPKIGLKDTTTAHWAMTVGTKGLRVALQRDRTQAENVIFGTGVAPNQSRWANTRYPNLRPVDPPAFPYADLGAAIENGTVDADTDSGTGVTDWQEAAFELGYDVVVDGTYGGTDEATCEEIQRRAGLPVTGEVDADTWTFTFNVGADVGDLSGAYFAPIAEVSAREPFLYDAAGSKIGPNPDYDPRVMRVERWVDYGEGVTRAEAAQSARLQLSRANGVDFSGTLTLNIDPEAGSRWHIRAGQNINLKWYRGRPTTLLHIARVECQPESGTVTLTVDTQARDLPTLAAVRQRNKDATDPARALRGKRTSSRTQPDLRPVWDAESGAGRIPSFPKTAASWSVVRVPAGQAGTISTLTMSTTGSASRFAVGIFGRPITPADMVRLIGDPLEPDADDGSKWDSNVLALEAEGLLAAFGGYNQAAGYYPGTDPDSGSDGSHVLTGKLVDQGGFLFDSLYPPWLWVAVWSDLACYVRGRLFLSVLDA